MPEDDHVTDEEEGANTMQEEKGEMVLVVIGIL